MASLAIKGSKAQRSRHSDLEAVKPYEGESADFLTCRMIAWISDVISLSDFSGAGLLHSLHADPSVVIISISCSGID